jgi:hypothetical protein
MLADWAKVSPLSVEDDRLLALGDRSVVLRAAGGLGRHAGGVTPQCQPRKRRYSTYDG